MALYGINFSFIAQNRENSLEATGIEGPVNVFILMKSKSHIFPF